MSASKSPLYYAPRGLSRIEAARYIGISPPIFDQMVGDGRMPIPRKINTRLIWDRNELDTFFEELPTDRTKEEAEQDKWSFLSD